MTHVADTSRAFLTIAGDDRVHFLQGLLTQDIAKLADEKIQFAALLSPQGKILHDMFVIDQGDHILLDTAATLKDALLKRLTLYKLRAKVTIADATHLWQLSYSTTTGFADPRHPEMPKRLITQPGDNLPSTTLMPEDYHTIRLNLGIPELGSDFASDQVVPMDAGYDLLHAISFTKGCYVGQEVTARMHYKNIARRGFYQLNDGAGHIRLALLRFEEIGESGKNTLMDNCSYHATLPAWLKPKYMQFLEGKKNQ